ncbi:hypothetical protein OG937_05950 [Streptomyces sp. NBC_00510]
MAPGLSVDAVAREAGCTNGVVAPQTYRASFRAGARSGARP